MSQSRFTRFAWGLLFYNLAVILWGAFVRATVSGDGCGAHWPTCGGAIVPSFQHAKTLIEFIHRASTGPLTLCIFALVFFAFRLYPKRHPARFGAVLCLIFTLSEGLIGAALVLKQLVAHNDSIFRAVYMSAHLINTFLLLSAITLTAWWSSGRAAPRLRGQGAVGYALLFGVIGTLVLGISGAITALGDTLFPVSSLLEGIRQDLSPTAHLFIRLRPLHPLIAMSVGLYLLLIAGLIGHLRPSVHTQRFGRWVGILFLSEIGFGALNLFLQAPIAMQLGHLLLADMVWINLVLLCGAALAEDVPQVELLQESLDADGVPIPALNAVATWKDYLALTKPRVISLLLFTTLATMFIAADARHPVTIGLFVAVAIGGYMAAGAANAINMVIDSDIDGRMKRTASRPTVTQQIPSALALRFAFLLAFGSFALLWWAANLLAAMLALAGLVFYVIVYTLLLKRRTWHNIVIGGAAGAFPPLVGWAAVTGNLSVLAWYLFAIIFVWTPVHFWALALLLKDDYTRAGVPMLPSVRGERATVVQIACYAVLTAVVSVLPFFAPHEVGQVYFVSAILLNAALLLCSLQLYRRPERPQASKLFHYSMVYLALLFLVMAVDRSFHF
jgi:protoheme IX farnesyltransferase